MSFDLTLNNYHQLCNAIAERQTDCRVVSYLENKRENGLIVRHDVDRNPKRALRMATLENELGIRVTYYFRSTKNAFKPKIMKKIEEMGHEVGYHYEVLAKANGDMEAAWSYFSEELKDFRNIVHIHTICSHGSPLSKYDSRDLWKSEPFSKYGILGDASISINGTAYFSDTGGKWNSTANIRDRMTNSTNHPPIEKTKDLVDFIKTNDHITIYLNCHPERYSTNHFEAGIQSLMDGIFNIGKMGVIKIRKVRCQ